jgi:hypothetical protein
VGDDQKGVADRDQGAFLAAAPGEAVVAGAEEGLGPGGPDDCFAEGTAEPGVALAGGLSSCSTRKPFPLPTSIPFIIMPRKSD